MEHQSAICEAGALPTLVSMIRRYAARNDVNLSGVPAQTCRRTSDAITNLVGAGSSRLGEGACGSGAQGMRAPLPPLRLRQRLLFFAPSPTTSLGHRAASLVSHAWLRRPPTALPAHPRRPTRTTASRTRSARRAASHRSSACCTAWTQRCAACLPSLLCPTWSPLPLPLLLRVLPLLFAKENATYCTGSRVDSKSERAFPAVQVQRAVAGSLRTLAFKNDENKNIIVDLGSLPLLIQMLRSDDTTIHYEVRQGAGLGGALGAACWIGLPRAWPPSIPCACTC